MNDKILFRGAWFFQLKKDVNGKYKLLEISTRLPGAFSLSRGMDVNLPYLALQDFDDRDVIIDYNDYDITADKQFFTKYSLGFEYNEVYISINSLLFEKKINQYIMFYIYQCFNKKIKVYLVYNDNYEMEQIIKRPISNELFADIISYKKMKYRKGNQKKVYISSIQTERIEMRKKGFYSFETSSIEALIDWKM